MVGVLDSAVAEIVVHEKWYKVVHEKWYKCALLTINCSEYEGVLSTKATEAAGTESVEWHHLWRTMGFI